MNGSKFFSYEVKGKKRFNDMYDAVDLLARAGVKVAKDRLNTIQSGKLGLHYLGAVDYLRNKFGFVIVFVRP